MITDDKRSKWEVGLVYAFVVLGVAVPCCVAVFPLGVNIVRREREFGVGRILATWVFALVLSLSALVFCCTTSI
jgi:hypothetical protein